MNGSYVELLHLHAPVLALGALLGGAGLAVLTPHARLSWLIALVSSLAAAAFAFVMAVDRLFGAAPAVRAEAGVALTLDGVAAFAAPLVTVLTVMSLLAAAPAVRAMSQRAAPYAMALALCVGAGWLGALLARDLIGLIVGAQLGWLACVGLIGLSGDRGALNGALRMWAAGGAGAALMLLGLVFVTRALGGVDVAAAASVHIAAPHLAIVGYVLLLLPLALAAGAAPLYSWAGPAYGRARDFTLLSVGGVGAIGAIAVLTRLSAFIAFAPAVAEGISVVLVVLGVASVLIGALQAVGAVNVQRLVAYAGATQVGCILLALALESPAGFAAALIQMLAWAAGALALLIGASAARGAELGALDGLARRAPIASIAITAGALSLMGSPLTIGFLGRWRLIEASVGAGWWWATGAAIAASLAAVFYGGRLIERVYFRRATATTEADLDPWRAARVPVAIAAIAAIAMGIAPSVLTFAADRAAALMLAHAQ